MRPGAEDPGHARPRLPSGGAGHSTDVLMLHSRVLPPVGLLPGILMPAPRLAPRGARHAGEKAGDRTETPKPVATA